VNPNRRGTHSHYWQLKTGCQKSCQSRPDEDPGAGRNFLTAASRAIRAYQNALKTLYALNYTLITRTSPLALRVASCSGAVHHSPQGYRSVANSALACLRTGYVSTSVLPNSMAMNTNICTTYEIGRSEERSVGRRRTEDNPPRTHALQNARRAESGSPVFRRFGAFLGGSAGSDLVRG
jgi:hypothetical protein